MHLAAWQIQMKSRAGDVGGGKVDEAANRKGCVAAFWQQKIEQTVRIAGIDFVKTQVRAFGSDKTVTYKHGSKTVICQTIGGDHL